jgi:2-polyprenyl-3-methyl-5-hydroxy-6-metoxy-1,4-benzoquinol methylase
MSDGAAACRDCGDSGRLVHEDLQDRHFGVEGTWRLLHCRACERFWLDPVPDPEELRASYRNYYTHTQHREQDDLAPRGFEPWLKSAVPAARLGYGDRVSLLSRLAGRALSSFGPLRTIGERAVLWLPAQPGGRLLDVGCGSGELLARMRDLGWSVAGVEFDAEAARVARERSGSQVVSTLDEIEAAVYDAVILDHVLEHLPDAPATLAGCLHALRPGGWLALATPNPSSAGRDRFGASWLHWDPPRHLELRGERALRRLVETSGFAVERMFSCAGSAHFVWSASRGIERDGVLPGIRVATRPLAERLAGLRFWLDEHARVSRGEACGEEWIVLARRPVEANEGAVA